MPEDLQERLRRITAEVRRGGAQKYHDAAAKQGKLFCRDRLALLLDEGSLVEDGVLANIQGGDLPADGVVTGYGRVAGRIVCVMANDSTVKAGSWGKRTVEKILRVQETAMRLRVPIVYLVDSAGARITDQLEMFAGRRGAGRIFSNQVHMSGMIPQICLLFGPSAAGGAYIPAFCDVLVMIEGNASMYLGSPRLAEEVVGEQVTLEEMGGARMHCSVSGCGDVLVQTEQQALEWCKRYLSYLPQNFAEQPPLAASREPAPHRPIPEMIPLNQNKPFDMRELVSALIDEDSWCEIKQLFAGELLTGLARIDGRVIGVIASQPKIRGGVLFTDSADKAARFIWLCDAFNIPLLFLCDVPGFMIGSKVERGGIIRHGAKMISAVTEATVPKISVIIRKAYGASLYAMGGPAFDPEATIALPQAMIAVMGPEAAVNAVYAKKIAELPEDQREAFISEKEDEYRTDLDVYRLASELIVDAIIEPDELRTELIARLDATPARVRQPAPKRRPITPV